MRVVRGRLELPSLGQPPAQAVEIDPAQQHRAEAAGPWGLDGIPEGSGSEPSKRRSAPPHRGSPCARAGVGRQEQAHLLNAVGEVVSWNRGQRRDVAGESGRDEH